VNKLETRVQRLEAKAAPFDAIRILVAVAQPDGSESAPLMLVYGVEPRPATAAEIAGDGAGCVVTMQEEDLNL